MQAKEKFQFRLSILLTSTGPINSMANLLLNCLIFHIPKTGSDWTRAASQEVIEGLISEVGEWH